MGTYRKNNVDIYRILSPAQVFHYLLRVSIITLICIIFTFSLAQAATKNVPADYTTIQEALDAATVEVIDEIIVADGTYYENIVWPTSLEGIYLHSQNGPDYCTIDGGNNDTVLYIYELTAIILNDITIEGFTITNGFDTGGDAGGIIVYSAHIDINNCKIIYNTGRYSGGIASGDRGGSFTARNCLIANNTATLISTDWTGGGATFWADLDFVRFINCTITDNNAQSNGSDGLQINGQGGTFEVTIKNCIIRDNDIDGTHRDIYLRHAITTIESSNINNVDGTYDEFNIINAGPKFVDPDSGDFHLQATSPCIDSGTASGVPTDDLDNIGTAVRPNEYVHDMGCYEYIHPAGIRKVHNLDYGRDYFNIRGALHDARDGDEIVVDDGTYIENIIWPAYLDNVYLHSQNGADDCIISGDDSGIVFYFWSSDPTFVTGITIEGFTISDGTDELMSWGDAGGFAIYRAYVDINNCKIINNTGKWAGGIDGGQGSEPPIEVNVRNCLFSGNTSTYTTDNQWGGGAASFWSNSRFSFTNCTITNNNSLSDAGDGLLINNDGGFVKGTIKNCIIWGNGSTDLNIQNNVSVEAESSDIGTLTLVNSPPYTANNIISADPDFTSPTSGDFHLLSGSHCIDTGTAEGAPDDDLDNVGTTVRPNNYLYDIGCYEYSGTPQVHNGSKDYFSIRAALAEAQAGDTIEIDAGTLYEYDIPWALNNITLRGSGSGTTIIDAFRLGRVISFEAAVSATIEGVTIQKGWLDPGHGGGIYLPGGSILRLKDVVMQNCLVDDDDTAPDGLTLFDGLGSAIFSRYATVEAEDCQFINNGNMDTFNCYGGVAYSAYGTWQAINCTFSNNRAEYGGAIEQWVSGIGETGSFTALNCTFDNNIATSGGGVFEGVAVFVAANCTFSSNKAYDSYSYGDYEGVGGVLAWGDTVETINCTFEGNTATIKGGVSYQNTTGFTATNCTFTNNSAGDKGGVSAEDNWTVTNCLFEGNSAIMGGVDHASNWTVSNSTFRGNIADDGSGDGYGAIAEGWDGGPTGIWNVSNCLFIDNIAASSGIVDSMSKWTVTNSIFKNNTATNTNPTEGGGISVYTTIMEFSNCIFDGNSAVSKGGLFNYITTTTATNCSFYNNTAAAGSIAYNSDLTVTNSIFWGQPSNVVLYSDMTSPPLITYSDIQAAGWIAGTGNISQDPLFASTTYGNDNYLRLSSSSPCIDSASSEAPSPDLAGNTRPRGLANDMGVYEFQGPSIRVDSPNGGEFYDPGDNINITWTASDPDGILANSININYSSDGGTTWIPIAVGEADDGTYESWTAPEVRGTQYLVEIEVTNINAVANSDTSNNTFTLTLTPLEVWVSPTGSDEAGAGTLASPWQSIEFALENVAGGGTIYALGGTYNEHDISWPDKDNITLKAYGEASPPIIDAQQLGRVITVSSPVNLTIEGFTLQNGYLDPGSGGGIYLAIGTRLGLKDVVIKDCTVNGTADPPTSYNGMGGAVFSNGATVEAENSIFTGNSAIGVDSVGGVAYAGDWTATNCIFSENDAEWGGVVEEWDSYSASNWTTINCIFFGNSGRTEGGIAENFSGSWTSVNCIFWGNASNNPGTHLFSAMGCPTSVTYSDIQENAWIDGTGNLSGNPQFISTTYGNPDFFRLPPASTCVDTGTNEGAAEDIEGTSRPQSTDGRFDMGVYEYIHTGTRKIHNATQGKNYYTIHSALYDAQDGDLITVEAGTFYENDIIWPDINNITLRGEGPELTIIDAQDQGRGISIIHDVNVTIEGFTITNGYTMSTGGGIHCNNETYTGPASILPNIKVKNCHFIDNFAADIASGWGGGAIYIRAYDIWIDDCIFKENSSFIGNGNGGPGAIALDGVGAGASGGEECYITNSLFWNNHGEWTGAICIYQYKYAAIESCTFVSNEAKSASWSYGGGIYTGSSYSNATFINNSIFWYNSAVSGGSQIYDEITGVEVTYSNVQGGSLGVGGATLSTGTINAEPKFVSTTEADLHLQLGSPCLDTGTNTGAPDKDIAGTDRPQPTGGIVDMGVFEYSGTGKVHNQTQDKSYFSIPIALNEANEGDLITVEAGTFYTYDLTWPSTDHITLRGAGADLTIIDAQRLGRVFSITTGVSATIEGFTITGGYTTGNGGGINIAAGNTLTVINCHLVSNEAANGSAIFNYGTSIIDKSKFLYNRANYWAAVRSDGLASYGSMVIANSIIAKNYSNNSGGGLTFYQNDHLEIINCVIEGNDYAGIHCNASPATIKNTVFWNNSDDIQLFGAAYNVSYCDIEDGDYMGTNGNISLGPRFFDAANADYRILHSPLVNTGTNEGVVPPDDILGVSRPVYGTYDIGAYEVNEIVVTNYNPAGSETDVRRNTNIEFDIVAPTEVDAGTITLAVNGTSVTPIINTIIDGYYRYQVVYDPLTDFTSGETVTVLVEAEDMVPDSYSFEVRGTKVHNVTQNEWYTYIQNALNEASSGDAISVSDGTYRENIVWPHTLENIYLYSENGPNSCIVNGGGTDTVFYIEGASPLLSGITIEGFTITDGYSSGYTGGVVLYWADADFINCKIINNQGGWVGGISNEDGKLDLINCLVSGNQAITNTWDDETGGVYAATWGDPTIINITNCTITDNDAVGTVSNGDGLQLEDGGGSISGTVKNSIIYGNDQGDVTIYPGGTVTLNIEYSDVGTVNGSVSTSNSISLDPQFTDTAGGDFHLSVTSPCVDTATSEGAPAEDLEGISRPQLEGYDMGAYEFKYAIPAPPTVDPLTTPTPALMQRISGTVDAYSVDILVGGVSGLATLEANTWFYNATFAGEGTYAFTFAAINAIDEQSEPTTVEVTVSAEALSAPAPAGQEGLGQATVVIPVGVVQNHEANIDIESKSGSEIETSSLPVDTELVSFALEVTITDEDGEEITALDEAITITIPFAAEGDEWQDFHPYWFNQAGCSCWLRIPDGDIIEKTADHVTFLARHLSLFAVLEPLATDEIKPTINELLFDGLAIESEDFVNPRPVITASVSDEGGSGIDTSSIVMVVDGDTATHTYTVIDANSGTISYQPQGANLARGLHSLTIDVSDGDGNAADTLSMTFDVENQLRAKGALPFPCPVDPTQEPVKISYNLSTDAAIMIAIYNINHDLVWRTTIAAGAPGGRRGYNEVPWNGISLSGQLAPNDVYYFYIISGQTRLAKGKLVILK